MATVRERHASPMHARTCLHCGYQGRELQRSDDAAAYFCPSCHADLYARPARSYAEMEGFAPAASNLITIIIDDASRIRVHPPHPTARHGLFRLIAHRVLRCVNRVFGRRAT